MTFAQALLRWYDENKRVFPWRGPLEPYSVMVSEIMLQQTRTETVKKYFPRFMDTFPDVRALAAAEEQHVLKLWEGLGYYSRARNLRKAAIAVRDNHAGVFPATAKELMTLPGVGKYTAHAIASISFSQPVLAMDGNLARVFARVLCHSEPVSTPWQLEKPAMEFLDFDRPGDFNQALMDLGELICTPASPKCAECPVSRFCIGYKEDMAQHLPVALPKPVKKEEDICFFIVLCRGKVAVIQRPAKGLLANLWSFPCAYGKPEEICAQKFLRENGFENARVTEELPPYKHVFTHLIWHVRGFAAVCDAMPEGIFFADRHEFDRLPFPTALKPLKLRAAALLEESV